jgi:radical SAM superfamily enzyme YgiQ (UPF0313 family)
MARNTQIWISDLTYTQQSRSSDVMPAAIGCLATYATKHLDPAPDFRLFKLPEKLIEAIESDGPPDIIGFSNYVWNGSLSLNFMATVKRLFPKVITVAGGPNYPLDASGQEAFLREHSMVDFYIVGEGEQAFVSFIEALTAVDFDRSKLTENLPSVHWIDADGQFRAGEKTPRLRNISDVSSPYLSGLMDEFFDGSFMPIIQTNRGCPFTCTFCVEGEKYYTYVAKKRSLSQSRQELEYIARLASEKRREVGGRGDMFIADSNFGMYEEDLDFCRAVAEMQEKYDFPEYVNVATGKNKKERVLEAAKIMNGALRLSGSVQTLDEEVLDNIARSNISADEIVSLALAANEIGANSYAEIILGLPGETKESHFRTIRKMLGADFNALFLWQLMLLPGTPMSAPDFVGKWGMVTKYRVIPRCCGYYDCMGENINSAEIERIVVASDTLSFDDYLDCRRMHLIVNMFYNDCVFKDVLQLLKMLDIPKDQWIERIHQCSTSSGFNSIMEKFVSETKAELWDSKDELASFVQNRENIGRFLSGELGANLIFNNRAYALIQFIPELAEVATITIDELLADKKADESIRGLARELVRYGQLRMTNILQNFNEEPSADFTYNVVSFSENAEINGLDSFKQGSPQHLSFVLEPEQVKTVEASLKVYGDTLTGRARILGAVFIGRLLRTPVSTTVMTVTTS